MKIFEVFGCNSESGGEEYNHANHFIAGVECEIESVREDQNFPGFVTTTDGSLRNNGYEFISIPLGKSLLMEHFTNLHATIRYHKIVEAFSPRTSTHVHVNCRGLEMTQLHTLVMLYALFEEVFFCMVEENRRSNIHCVPLTETYLPSLYKSDPLVMFKRWHKYTALNILPLQKYGTVEFRHLQGTGSPEVFSEWLTALENLWVLCQREIIDEKSLNHPETINHWFDSLFFHSPRIQAIKYSVPNLIKNSLLDVKLSLIK